MRESALTTEILAQLARGAVRLFRNNCGFGWQAVGTKKLDNGDMILRQPRLIRFGLFKGSADYIGWVSVTITPEMVGQTLAVFTAMEFKKTGGGKRSQEQKNFIKAVKAAGGRAGFADSIEKARAIITGEL